MSDPRAELVDLWVARLETVVSTLAGGVSSTHESLGQVWSACEEAYGALREANEVLTDRRADEDLLARLDRAAKLQALALSLAARENEAACGRLEQLADLKRRLRCAERAGPTGESCDIRG